MLFFMRKRLFLDTNAMEFARIKDILAQNGIKFEVNTTVSENAMTRKFNSAAAAHLRQNYSAFSTQTYLYMIYVKRSDYEKAKALAYSKKGAVSK